MERICPWEEENTAFCCFYPPLKSRSTSFDSSTPDLTFRNAYVTRSQAYSPSQASLKKVNLKKKT